MDELQRAVAQFYPTSGGINEGGFSQPPNPTPPTDDSGLGLIPGAQSEGDRPDSNNYASASSQEAHQGEMAKKKLLHVLERHLRKHCASRVIIQKYPYVLNLKDEDFHYFAEHIAISELDVDYINENQQI